MLLGVDRAFERCGTLRRSSILVFTGSMVGNGWERGRKREEEGTLSCKYNVLLDRVDTLSLVLLYRTTNLHECHSAERSQQAKKARTVGKPYETLNITFALHAVSSLSRSLTIIWFSIRDTLYTFLAVTHCSVPSVYDSHISLYPEKKGEKGKKGLTNTTIQKTTSLPSLTSFISTLPLPLPNANPLVGPA